MIDFNYQVIRRPRRKTASITIKPDNTVTVVVPASVTDKQIVHFLQRKTPWIQNTLHFNLHSRPSYSPKEYVTGESFLYLGKKYRLKVNIGGQRPVKLIRGEFHVHVLPRLSPQEIQDSVFLQLSQWYRDHAAQHLRVKTNKISKLIGVSPNRICVKSYKSRWGSCSNRGVISFNWKIIMAPPAIVEYVIIHELCHLKHLNHSKTYWNLVARVIPDFRQRRKWLKVNGLQLEI
jgi:predicted metal-dependent hydrolase